jgi:hypothetical protein
LPRRLAMWSAETVVACALMLLTRSAASLPPIEFVDAPPAYVSPLANAFVRVGEARIYLVTSSDAFRRAQRANYRCGDLEAVRMLASVIVHEEWHVKHGRDEVEAYHAQLMTLRLLGADSGNPAYTAVSRSARAALARRKTVERVAKRAAKEAANID